MARHPLLAFETGNRRTPVPANDKLPGAMAEQPPSPVTEDELVQAFFEDARDALPWIDHFGPDRVLGAVTRTIESGTRSEVAIALGFLRDACRRHGHAEFRARYLRSDLVDLLRTTLVARDRVWALVTLGRLGPRSNAEHLERVLPWYEEHDPFLLGSLLMYLAWWRDGRADRRRRLAALARSRHHLARWATVAILWDDELDRGKARHCPGWAVQLLRQLAQDPHPWIRQDARLALAERRRHRYRSGAPRPVDDELGPALLFEWVERLVMRHLHESGRDDFDAELVASAGAHVERHPDALLDGRVWHPG